MAFYTVRGTSDILPSDLKHWRRIERRAAAMAELYGYEEIRTPLFEKADLFIKGLGPMSGLVERDLWVFHDKHGQKLALRPEMTAPVVRALLQHKLLADGHPTKLYYNAPVFLLGKESGEPSRQSHQFGLEISGIDHPAADAELLCFAYDLCYGLGFNEDEISLELNTLGCTKCRPAFQDALRDFCTTRQGELCGNCKRKCRNHPTWVLSCPEAGCVSLANVAPTMLGYLCQDCKGHFNQLKLVIKELELNVNFNPRVVRDNEYYSKTAFRVVVHDRVVACGGRYDKLFADLGGVETPAVGVAFSVDELAGILPVMDTGNDELEVALWGDGEESIRLQVALSQKLRRRGIRAEYTFNSRRPNPGARLQVSLNETEIYRGRAEIYDADRQTSEKVSPDKLLDRLEQLLGLRAANGRSDSSGSGSSGSSNRRKLVRRQRESERIVEDVVEVSLETLSVEDSDDSKGEGSGESSSSRRRRRRRRKRSETSIVTEAVDAGDLFDEGEEDAVAEEVVEEKTERHPRSRRGRNHDRDRSEDNATADSSVKEEEGDDDGPRSERNQERGHRQRDRESRHQRPERSEKAERPANGGEESKTFIPRFLVGGASAAPVAAAQATPATASKAPGAGANIPAAGPLNWTIPAQSDMPEPVAAGEDRGPSHSRSRGRRR